MIFPLRIQPLLQNIIISESSSRQKGAALNLFQSPCSLKQMEGGLALVSTFNRGNLNSYFLAGCGSGKYLHINPDVFKIGVDRCARLTELAREKDHEVCTLISLQSLLSTVTTLQLN